MIRAGEFRLIRQGDGRYAVDVPSGARSRRTSVSSRPFCEHKELRVNSEQRLPGRIARIINRLRAIADAIDLDFQVVKNGKGNTVELRVTTRWGSLSWSSRSTADWRLTG
jgi:hypothetical protein